MVDDELTPQVTKFNAGIAKLMRIDRLRQALHDARMSHNYKFWYDVIISYRVELNERMNKEMRDIATESEKEIISILYNQDGITIYGALLTYELWLVDLERKFGFSMPDAPKNISMEV